MRLKQLFNILNKKPKLWQMDCDCARPKPGLYFGASSCKNCKKRLTQHFLDWESKQSSDKLINYDNYLKQ